MSMVFPMVTKEQNTLLNTVKERYVYEEANRQKFLEWAQEEGIEKQVDSEPSWVKMIPRKFQYIQEVTDELPGCEVQELFQRWNGTRVLVGHTYHLENFDWGKFGDFLDDRGLLLVGETQIRSWLNPGVTYTLMIEVADEEAYEEYIEENRMYNSKGDIHWI